MSGQYLIEKHKAGETIFEEGNPGHVAYVVKAGSVDVFHEVEGRAVFLGRLKQGEILGEMSIVTNNARGATAVAYEDVELIVLDKAFLYESLNETRPIVKSLLVTLIDRLSRSNKKISRLPSNNVYRTVCTVLQLLLAAREAGRRITDVNPVTISYKELCETIKEVAPLSQKDINTVLAELVKQELVRVFSKRQEGAPLQRVISVVDVDAFERRLKTHRLGEGVKLDDPFLHDQEFVDLFDFASMVGGQVDTVMEVLTRGDLPEDLIFVHKMGAVQWLAERQSRRQAEARFADGQSKASRDPFFDTEA